MNRSVLIAIYLAVGALTVVLFDENLAREAELAAVIGWALVSVMLGWRTRIDEVRVYERAPGAHRGGLRGSAMGRNRLRELRTSVAGPSSSRVDYVASGRHGAVPSDS